MRFGHPADQWAAPLERIKITHKYLRKTQEDATDKDTKRGEERDEERERAISLEWGSHVCRCKWLPHVTCVLLCWEKNVDATSRTLHFLRSSSSISISISISSSRINY